MTLESAKQILDGFVQRVVSTLGFDRVERLIYTRQVNEATALLSFPCRLDPRGPACFGCNIGLRFQSLEPFLHGESKPIVPTVMMPLHLLRENKKFAEWQFYTNDDLSQLRDTITHELTDIALPFVGRQSKLIEVRRKLESATPADWFGLGPEGRLTVLAAIQFVHGEKAGAMKILDDALLERKGALPAKRLQLEAVRKRLAQAL